jgi:TRAP-type transport system small permease protein
MELHQRENPQSMTRLANAMGKLMVVIDRCAETLIVILFATIALIGGLQVFFRYVLKNSLSWSEEFQRYGLIWLVFLAIGLGYRRNAHIGVDLLFNKLPRVAREVVAWIIDLLWLLLGASMVYYPAIYQVVPGRNFLSMIRSQSLPGLQIPMNVVYLCLLIGGAYIVLAAIHNLMRRAAGELAPAPPAEDIV